MAKLKKAASSDEMRRKEDKKQAEVYESHSKFMKSKVPYICGGHFNYLYSLAVIQGQQGCQNALAI